MDLKQQKKWDKMKSDSLYTSVESVKFNKITSFIKGGKLHFKNPKEAETLVAIPKSVKSKSSDEFTWAGVFEENRGDITLIAQDGDIFGRFNIDGEVYEIHDLGKKKNVMVKIKPTNTPMCGATNRNATGEPNPTESLASSRMSPPPLACDNNNIRVLVFYTPRAAESFTPANVAALAIQQLNTASINSGITQAELSYTLAGVVLLPGFEEDRSIKETFKKFKELTDNQVLRGQYAADLGVILTNKTYDEAIHGYIASISASQGNNGNLDFFLSGDWRCLINCNVATSMYGFAHEVSHLLRCDHEYPLDPIEFPVDKRAKKFATPHTRRCGLFFTCQYILDRQTIMTGIASTNTIPHFSNPDIDFQGISTGEMSVRNNARILKIAACQVANYLPYTPPITIGIFGPNYCNSSDSYTWCANTNDCPNPTNITWEFSSNGIDYTFLGSGACLTSPLPVNGGDYYVYLRVTATCGNNVVTTNELQITMDSYSSDLRNNTNESKTTGTTITDSEGIVISPNPSSEKVQVSLQTEASAKLTVSLQDLTGKTLKSIQNKDVNEGIMQFEFDVKSYPNGIYLIHIQSDSKTVTRKLTIQK